MADYPIPATFEDIAAAAPPPAQQAPVMAPPSMVPGSSPGWGDTIKRLIPFVFAGIAGAKGGRVASGAMLNGIASSIAHQQQQAAIQAKMAADSAATEQERQLRIAQFLQRQDDQRRIFVTDALEKLKGYDDPAQAAHAANIYEKMGHEALGIPPGWATTMPGRTGPNKQQIEAAKSDLAAAEKTAIAHGMTLDDLATPPAGQPPFAIKGADGKVRTIPELQALVGGAIVGPGGEPAQLPKKPEKPEPDAITTATTGAEYPIVVRSKLRAAQQKKGSPLTDQEIEAVVASVPRWAPTSAGQGASGVGTAATPPTAFTGAPPDPTISNKPSPAFGGLTPAATYQGGMMYALTGKLPSLGLGSAGVTQAKRDAILNTSAAMVDRAGANPALLQAEYGAASKTLKDLVGRYAFTAIAANSADTGIQLAIDQSQRVGRSVSPGGNKFAQWLQRDVTGGPQLPGLTAFEIYVYNAARDYAKVTTGSAQSIQGLTDAGSALADRLLNSAMPNDAFVSAARAMQTDMRQIKEKYLAEIANQSGTIANFFKAVTGGGETPLPVAPSSATPTAPTPTGLPPMRPVSSHGPTTPTEGTLTIRSFKLPDGSSRSMRQQPDGTWTAGLGDVWQLQADGTLKRIK